MLSLSKQCEGYENTFLFHLFSCFELEADEPISGNKISAILHTIKGFPYEMPGINTDFHV
ncbi:MAG: hypothetical protein K8R53_05005 [Bacteroidales bacterium]|nr:hypothetical protein [Bacteroidales bacterium]